MKKVRCPLCDQVFASHELLAGAPPTERRRVECPTSNCPGTPEMFVHPESPLTSDAAWENWEQMFAKWEKRHGGNARVV